MNVKEKNNVKNVIRLSVPVINIINHYLTLNLGGEKIVTPYYINSNFTKPIVHRKILANIKFHYVKKRTKQRGLIGKGNPKEIEKVTQIYAKKSGFNLETASKEEIKQFMEKYGIGVDCSGLVVWILNELTKEKYNKPVWHYINFNAKHVVKKLMILLRPIENISVKVLSNSNNSISINSILDIRVGDMIIGWWDEHVLLITEIGTDENNKPYYFEYINSTWWYGKNNGVLKGRVDISDIKGYLVEQTWEDFQEGKNWTFEGIKNEGKIVRLKILNS